MNGRGRLILVTALAAGVLALPAGPIAASSARATGTASLTQVKALVKSSTTIKSIPSGLTPTVSQAATDASSIKVSSVNYIKNSCDPYWQHQQAGLPVPCWYGDLTAKKVVVFWGDSNTGNWIPALNSIFKGLGYRLALFPFIGCDTSFMPETSSQKGFPGEWQLCNEWHQTLPGVVKKLKPVGLIEASTMLDRVGDASYNQSWVQGMVQAFSEMTLSTTIRIEFQTVPSRSTSPTACLASNPTNVQSCAINLSGSAGIYTTVQQRDQQIATQAKAILIPTWPLMCYQQSCPPIIGKNLVLVDADHLSTPFATYLITALKTEMAKLKALPPKV